MLILLPRPSLQAHLLQCFLQLLSLLTLILVELLKVLQFGKLNLLLPKPLLQHIHLLPDLVSLIFGYLPFLFMGLDLLLENHYLVLELAVS